TPVSSCLARDVGMAAEERSPGFNSRVAPTETSRRVEDFSSRAEEPYRVIPPRRDRQAVLDLAVAPAELKRNRAIRTALSPELILPFHSPPVNGSKLVIPIA